jgi:hypothetical protein
LVRKITDIFCCEKGKVYYEVIKRHWAKGDETPGQISLNKHGKSDGCRKRGGLLCVCRGLLAKVSWVGFVGKGDCV